MSYIIGKACDGVCDTACVNACPVDCINGPIDVNGLGNEVHSMSKDELIGKQLYIDPKVCIDCGACVPECPVDAIYHSEEEALKKEGNEESIIKNYEFYGREWKGFIR